MLSFFILRDSKLLCNPKCSAFCPHSWAARSNKFSLLASHFIRTNVVARRHLSRQALSLAVYFYACDSFFRKRHFCGFLIRFLQSVVFYFKGLEVAPQPKMLCILPPLVGCTLEQVLAVSESLRRRKPTSFIARPCLAPLSVAFSSFAKTKFCRIFPIQTTAPFLMLLFIARQALSLAVYFYACDSSSEQSLSFRFFSKKSQLIACPSSFAETNFGEFTAFCLFHFNKKKFPP